MIVNSDKLKLSASSIKTYEQCPRKWKFTYIDKLPKKKWPHTELGSFVHDALEAFHNEMRDHPVPRENWGKVLQEKCKLKLSKYSLTKEQKEKAKEMLDTYLTKLREDGMPNVLYNERGFIIELPGNITLRGFIDRVDRDGDSIILQDYKTGRSKYLDEFQLTVYALAMLKEFTELERVKGAYIVLGEGSKSIPYIISRTDTERCVSEITKVAGMIRSDLTWETRPSRLCSYCDFEAVCPATKAASASEWGNPPGAQDDSV